MGGPVLDDDDDDKWRGYPGHTRAKHRLVQYYLNPWFRKLGHRGRQMRVFDCFSGRGKYIPDGDYEPVELEHIEPDVEIPGSPPILLDRAIDYADDVGSIDCVFIEKEEMNKSILEDVLPSKQDLPANVSYTVHGGTFQDSTEQLVTETGGWEDIPTFFFIDPFGYKCLDYDVVTNLGSYDKFEFLITLMAEQFVRWRDVDKHQETLKVPFGTDQWKSELEDFRATQWEEDKAVEYYCERIQKQGPSETLSYLVTEEDSKAMEYYLVFGTNSEHGIKVMRDAMNEVGPGRFAYAPNRSGLAKDQQSLRAFNPEQKIERVKTILQTHFHGEEMPFENIVHNFVTELRYSRFREKHVRKALKQMEQDGEVSVRRITSKTERGLQKNDRVQFPEANNYLRH